LIKIRLKKANLRYGETLYIKFQSFFQNGGFESS